MVRQRADLEVEEIGAPMDVLWFWSGKPRAKPSAYLRVSRRAK